MSPTLARVGGVERVFQRRCDRSAPACRFRYDVLTQRGFAGRFGP